MKSNVNIRNLVAIKKNERPEIETIVRIGI